MAEYKIWVQIVLGYNLDNCCESTMGEGTVELDDTQVLDLVNLIIENNGETDVERLDLAKRLPDVYDILSKAYGKAAVNAEIRYWKDNGLTDEDLARIHISPDEYRYLVAIPDDIIRMANI